MSTQNLMAGSQQPYNPRGKPGPTRPAVGSRMHPQMTSLDRRKHDDAPDPLSWLSRHGDVMYRYALLHLADPSAAEDAVQEALLAGLQSYDRFAGQSSERTWLIGILRHKVIDHVRKVTREGAGGDPDGSAEYVTEHFGRAGLWAGGPKKWGPDAAQAFERSEFWEVYLKCLGNLPERMAMAFALREMDGQKSEQICELLDLSPTNLWTVLHRARTRLRRCLERNWFAGEK